MQGSSSGDCPTVAVTAVVGGGDVNDSSKDRASEVLFSVCEGWQDDRRGPDALPSCGSCAGWGPQGLTELGI